MSNDKEQASATVYTVAGAKGGVGKTTTSINVGASLAAAGLRTVVVELDLAMANLVDFIDTDVDIGEVPTLHEVLAGKTSVETATYETESGLWVVPSGTDLTGYAETNLKRLPDTVEALSESFDVVLLDTPAGLSEETMRPMQVSDELLLVSTPRVASVRNARNTKELSKRVGTDVRGLVLTKSGTGASPGADRIAAFLDVDLLGHVPEDDAVPHSQDQGRPVVVNAPNSGAAIAYKRIAEKLSDAAVSLPDEPPTGATDRAAVAQQNLTNGGSPRNGAKNGDGADSETLNVDTETVLAEAGQTDTSTATDATTGDQPSGSAEQFERSDHPASALGESSATGQSMHAAQPQDEPGREERTETTAGREEQAQTAAGREEPVQTTANRETQSRNGSSRGEQTRREPDPETSTSDGDKRQESSEQESESLSNRVLSLLSF